MRVRLRRPTIGTYIAIYNVMFIKRGVPMPRLEGERSNTGMYLVLLLVLLLIALVLLEYFGAIDLIPNFGRV